MSLAPFRSSREAPQGRMAGGRGTDDLRASWTGFTADYLADIRAEGRFFHTCTACDPMSFQSNAVRSPWGEVGDVHIFPSGFGAVYVSPMVDWDSESTALAIAVPRGLQPVYGLSVEGETIIGEALSELTDVPNEVPVLDDVEDILRYLRSRGLDDLAGDLEYKKCLIEENPDELPISLESAREFADFVATESLAGSPNVLVDSYGYVGLEWIIPDPLASRSGSEAVTADRGDDHVWGKGDGVLGLWFLSNGLVRVCGTSGPLEQGVERMRINSIVPPAYVMGEVNPFLSRLEGV